MNARQAEEHLLSLELFGMRFGLDRMHKLMTVLGMPQRRFASVHVVGSNGKSSTVRFIAAILERHGLRTGSYTSPHLESFAERIEVGERPVDPAGFGRAVARAAQAAAVVERTLPDGERVTQFELLTAAAYHELARARVEVAVIEAGLGGRHDATNVIPSRVQVLTGIALEHTRWLGPSVADIAAEKLAVVPDRGCLVAPALDEEVEAVVASVLAARHARRIGAEHEDDVPPLRAPGAFQRRNFALARTAARAFRGSLDDGAVAAAAAETSVAGRMEITGRAPITVLDGAHNPDGMATLAQALPAVLEGRTLTAVVSILDDKDAVRMLATILPLCEAVVLTRCDNHRALPPATLESLAGTATVREALARVGAGSSVIETVPDPRAALARARSIAGPRGAVLATGSIHLVSDLKREPAAARASAL